MKYNDFCVSLCYNILDTDFERDEGKGGFDGYHYKAYLRGAARSC